MIKEDYASYEVAKLLKEKGFNEQCSSTYDIAVSGGKPIFYKYDVLQFFPDGMKNSDDKYGMVISAPTHQMTMAWLREVHNINIDIVPIWNRNRWEYQIFIVTPATSQRPYVANTLYLDYEEAVEEALKYSLENLI